MHLGLPATGRTICGASPTSPETFRQQMVTDRRKDLTMLKQEASRLSAGSEVSNENPLPKAQSTTLSSRLQLWWEFNSWSVCPTCERLQPRELTLQGLDGLLDPYRLDKGKKCVFCKATRAVPQAAPTSGVLQNLDPLILNALQPLDMNTGPEMVAKDRLGRPNGYKLHGGMMTFSWRAKKGGRSSRSIASCPAQSCPGRPGIPPEHFRPTAHRKWVWRVLPQTRSLLAKVPICRRASTEEMAAFHWEGRSRVCIVAEHVSRTATMPNLDTTAIYHPSSQSWTQEHLGEPLRRPGWWRRQPRRASSGCGRHPTSVHEPGFVQEPGLCLVGRPAAFYARFGTLDWFGKQAQFGHWCPSAPFDERTQLFVGVLEGHASRTHWLGASKRIPSRFLDSQPFGMVLALSHNDHWCDETSTSRRGNIKPRFQNWR